MSKRKLLSLVMVLFVFAVMAFGSGESKKDEGTVTNTDTETTTDKNDADDKDTDDTDQAGDEEDQDDDKPANNVVKKGGSFEKAGLKFTFKEFKDNYKPSDDKFNIYKPSKGKKIIACTFKFENNGDSDEYVSVTEFNCYADNESCKQEFIQTDDFKNTGFINDNLSPGRNVTFTAFYQVPKKAKNIQLEYEADFWSNEKIIIEVK